MARIVEQSTGAEALAFDDVLLVPGYLRRCCPADTDIGTRLTRSITLNLPIVSAAMDTVTEARLAIAMAQAGGIGVIHRNLSPDEQAEQVRQVKKFESGMVVNPVTIDPDATLADALALMKRYSDFRHSGGREGTPRRPPGRHPHQPRRALRLRSVAEGGRADDPRRPGHGRRDRSTRTRPSGSCISTASRSCSSSTRTIAASA